MERALRGAADVENPAERFEAVWTSVIASVTANRPLWTTQFEVLTQLGRQPSPSPTWATAQEHAQAGLAALFHGIEAAAEPELARVIGGFYHALLTGVVVQHLAVPDQAMSGRDLAFALRAVHERLNAGAAAGVAPAAGVGAVRGG